MVAPRCCPLQAPPAAAAGGGGLKRAEQARGLRPKALDAARPPAPPCPAPPRRLAALAGAVAPCRRPLQAPPAAAAGGLDTLGIPDFRSA